MFESIYNLLWSTNFFSIAVRVSISLLVIWYAKFRYSRRELYRLASMVPQVPNALPFIGNAHHLLEQDYVKYLRWINKVSDEKGGVLGFWAGPNFLAYITTAEDQEIIGNATQFKNTSGLFTAWLGNGLIASYGELYKSKKKVLTPTFHPRVLDGYMEDFNKQSKILVEKLKKAVALNTFDVHDYINPCTLDITGATLMGVCLNIQDNPNHPYLMASADQLYVTGERLVKTWLRSDFVFNLTTLAKRQKKNITYLKDLTLEIVKEKIASLEANPRKEEVVEYDDDEIDCKPRPRKALLDSILETNNSDVYKSEIDYANEVDTFMFAASDTVSNSTCFALLSLGSNSRVQDKLAKELFEIFGDSNRDVTKEDLTKMVYTECVMKEVLRLFPGAAIIYRCLEKDLKLSTCTLPANTTCIVNLFGAMRRKDIWGKDADEFRPERFLQGNLTREQAKSYTTFGVGPRDCIGKLYAMKATMVILSTVIRNYIVKTDTDFKSIELQSCFVLKAFGGWNVYIKPRY